MQFEKWFNVDLLKPRGIIPDLGFPVFTGDNNSVRFGVNLFSNKEPIDASGTVTGYVILPNGMMTPPITGEKDGNKVWIDLPEIALELTGRIQVAIRLIDGNEETVISAASATVRRVDSDTIIDPDDVVPTWEDILTKIAQMDAAADACEDAAAEATAAASHAVRYDEAQTLTDAQKEQARDNIGAASAGEVSSLKSAFAHSAPDITSIFGKARRTFFSAVSEWEQGAIVNGVDSASTTRVRTKNKAYIPAGTTIKFITSNYLIMPMYDLKGNYIETYPSNWSNTPAAYTMAEDRMIRLAVRNFGSTDLTPDNAKTSIEVFSGAFDDDIQTLYANGGEYAPFASVFDWEQGAINNGTLVDSTTRIRTKNYWSVPKGASIEIASGDTEDATALNFYVYALYSPDNGALIDIQGWLSGATSFVTSQNVLLKIAARKRNSATITPSEMNLTIMIRASGTVSEISKLKVLAMGDSICYGARNDRKGFIGEVGCQYVNIGSTGASISMAKTNNIPKQLIELTGFSPDAIVTNGGINDYGDGVAMGDVPVRVIDPNNDNPETMNKNTVMGALNYLFYKMVTLYPNAQRFFLMPQHTWNWDRIDGSGGWNFDTFHENVTKVCNMYGVKIIDLYTQSPINTRYAEYRSATSYSETPPDTEKAWVNYDGIHPLPFGYTNGYVPFVKEALKTATHKET